LLPYKQQLLLKNLTYKNRTRSTNECKIDLRESSNEKTLATPNQATVDPSSSNAEIKKQEQQEEQSQALTTHTHWIHIDARKWNHIISIYCGRYSISDWYLKVEGIKDLEVVKVHSYRV
jgi:uncharacterized protein YchJ